MSSARNHTTTVQAISRLACSQTTSVSPKTRRPAARQAAYLLEHSYLGTDSVDVRVEQGYEIDRPSLLYLQAARDGDEMRVDVGGKVQMVARGELV